MTYTIPHVFHQGLKASAVEVNDNFNYILRALHNISSQKIEFCVNSAHRDSQGFPDLVKTNGTNISIDQSVVPVVTDGNSENYKILTTLAPVVPVRATIAQTIPVMSSATSEDFSITTSSENLLHQIWHAVDGDASTYYLAETGVNSVSLTLNFLSSPKTQCAFSIARHATAYNVTGIKVYGRTADSSRTVFLQEISSAEIAALSTIDDYKFAFPVETKFPTYLIEISSNAVTFGLSSIKLYSRDVQDLTPEYIDQKQYVYINNESITASAAKVIRQVTQPAVKAYYKELLPIMTGNSYGGVVITPSSETSSHEAFHAADGKSNTYWQPTPPTNATFAIQLSGAIKVSACKIQASTTLSNFSNIMQGSLQGSADGTTWTNLYCFSKDEWIALGETRYFYFPQSENYTYFRLSGDIQSLTEFQLYTQSGEDSLTRLGQVESGDIWFNPTEPFSAKVLSGESWLSTTKVPCGEYLLKADASVTNVVTYDYNQNGISITGSTEAKNAGNILTKDAFKSQLLRLGYTTIPIANGRTLIIQWGTSLGTNNNLFPIAFPNAVLSFTAVPQASSVGISAVVSLLTKSQFCILNGRNSTQIDNLNNSWIAIGW